MPQIFFVVVVPSIDINRSNSEEFAELVQGVQTPGALNHNKRMTHLPPGSIADSVVAAGLTSQADGKTTFAINETEQPPDRDQSFLLIVRTRRIVTHAYEQVYGEYRWIQPDLPANSQMYYRVVAGAGGSFFLP
jgi:hypothetical protein